MEGSVAAFAAWPRLGMSQESIELPLAADLDGHALLRRLAIADVAKVERLGLSREGRPIDLISIGRGSRAALIVGAPHANEPIGCATIIRLLTRLARDRALREGLGWQWHFIPAIDIDGIALNEGWFRGERTLERYLNDFYRPPFRLQPEYAFPLDVPGYRFDQQTPESSCWRLALDHIRPQLQCSLHGADTGGSFFLVSDCQPRLCKALAGLPAQSDITLNTVGDASVELAQLAPGIFSFPNIDSLIAKAVSAHKPPDDAWNAGDSSAGYSTKRFRTFNMVCEVPLWRDARERDPRDSGRSLAEVVAEEIRMLRADEKLLTPFLPALRTESGEAAAALFASVEEAVRETSGAIEELEGLKASAEAQRTLSNRDLVQYEYGTAMFRTLAMAERLARLTGVDDLRIAARHALQERLIGYQRSARLIPVPLRSSTDLQMAAILTTAGTLTVNSA
jgi:hypothetical protein